MARINAGKYRHIVTFQRLKEAQNLYGETSTNVNENWENAFNARVGIFPISGREALSEDVRKGEISHRIVLRYTKGIESTMRVKFGERYFDIISPPINTQERNDELLLFAKERDVKPIGYVAPEPLPEPTPEPTPEPLPIPRAYYVDVIPSSTAIYDFYFVDHPTNGYIYIYSPFERKTIEGYIGQTEFTAFHLNYSATYHQLTVYFTNKTTGVNNSGTIVCTRAQLEAWEIKFDLYNKRRL